MSLFTQWLTWLRQAIYGSEEPEPVPASQPLIRLETLYTARHVEEVRRVEIHHGKAMAYEEIKTVLTTPLLSAEQKVQQLEQRILDIADFEKLHNPYQQQGAAMRFHQQQQMEEGPTQLMHAVAPAPRMHRNRLRSITTGHAAMPTAQEDKFTL